MIKKIRLRALQGTDLRVERPSSGKRHGSLDKKFQISSKTNFFGPDYAPNLFGPTCTWWDGAKGPGLPRVCKSVRFAPKAFKAFKDFLHSDENEKPPCWNCSVGSLSNIFALVIKNWITMKRSPVLLIFIFLLPGILMSLTCISVGIDPVSLPIGVLNFESNCTGVNLNVSPTMTMWCLRTFTATFFSGSQWRHTQGSCEADVLSCYYTHALNNTEAVHLVIIPSLSLSTWW